MTDEVRIFTAETVIVDALQYGEKVEHLFASLGLKCAGKKPGQKDNEWCAAVEKETLSDAALYHEVDLEKIITSLNDLKLPKEPPKEDES